MITPVSRPHVSTSDEPPIYFLGLPTNLRAAGDNTNGAFGLVDSVMPAGFASPYHTHRQEDEAFYLVDGEMAFVCGDQWTFAGPGTYVFGPRHIPHGFKVMGDRPARMLLLCAPSGFEQFVLEMSEPAPAPPDMAKLMAVAAKYDIEIHGPLPDSPAPPAGWGASAPDVERVCRRWIQAFNNRDWAADAALQGPGFRAHLSGTPNALDSAGWAVFTRAFASAFPDARITIDACVVQGDTAFARWTLTGTHQGEFHGIPPSGHRISIAGLEQNRVAGGLIVEHWGMFDNIALLQQIGAMPA